MVKGVIFDMDGLMFDSEKLSTILWAQAGEETGIEIKEAFVDRFRGRNPEAIRNTFLDEYGAEFDYEKCSSIKTRLMHKYVEEKGVPVKYGLLELLQYLKEAEMKMAVATSTERPLAEKMLKREGVYEYFHAMAFGDMVERSKPYPDIFLEAAKLMEVPIENCLVLEDSVAGVEAGKAAGGYIIHIPDVLQVPKNVKTGITAEMKNLKEVIPWIEKENNSNRK